MLRVLKNLRNTKAQINVNTYYLNREMILENRNQLYACF